MTRTKLATVSTQVVPLPAAEPSSEVGSPRTSPAARLAAAHGASGRVRSATAALRAELQKGTAPGGGEATSPELRLHRTRRVKVNVEADAPAIAELKAKLRSTNEYENLKAVEAYAKLPLAERSGLGDLLPLVPATSDFARMRLITEQFLTKSEAELSKMTDPRDVLTRLDHPGVPAEIHNNWTWNSRLAKLAADPYVRTARGASTEDALPILRAVSFEQMSRFDDAEKGRVQAANSELFGRLLGDKPVLRAALAKAISWVSPKGDFASLGSSTFHLKARGAPERVDFVRFGVVHAAQPIGFSKSGRFALDAQGVVYDLRHRDRLAYEVATQRPELKATLFAAGGGGYMSESKAPVEWGPEMPKSSALRAEVSALLRHGKPGAQVEEDLSGKYQTPVMYFEGSRAALHTEEAKLTAADRIISSCPAADLKRFVELHLGPLPYMP